MYGALRAWRVVVNIDLRLGPIIIPGEDGHA